LGVYRETGKPGNRVTNGFTGFNRFFTPNRTRNRAPDPETLKVKENGKTVGSFRSWSSGSGRNTVPVR